MTPLQKALDKLALELIREVSEPGVAPEDKIDAFKAVSLYHLGKTRIDGKQKVAEDPAGTFGAIVAKVNGKGKLAPNGQ